MPKPADQLPRCVVYCRVSTDTQARDGASLPEQRRTLRVHAKAKGWRVVAELADEGISGATIDARPGMLEVLRLVRSRETDFVLVSEWERLSRSPHARDWPLLLDACEESGVVLATPGGTLDARNLEDSFLAGLFGLLSARERSKITRRTLKGKIERVEQGTYLPGREPPYGYRYDAATRSLVVHEDEARMVLRIFELYGGGKSLYGISRTLHDEGFRSRKGGHLAAKTARAILSNPIYIGRVTIGRHRRKGLERHLGLDEVLERQGSHEPLVDVPTFERVQARLESRAGRGRTQQGRERSEFFVSGLVDCPACGARMNGVTQRMRGREYRYYRCMGVTRGQPHHPVARAGEVEEAVLDRMEGIGQDVGFVDEAHRRILFSRMKTGTADARRVGELRESLRKAEERELEAFKAMSDGTLTAAQFKRIAAGLEGERTQLEQELAAAEDQLMRAAAGGVDVAKILRTLAHLRTIFGALAPHEKREAVRSLVARVHRVGEEWRVELREPFLSLLEGAGEDAAEGESNAASAG